jgi:hypothetical protein
VSKQRYCDQKGIFIAWDIETFGNARIESIWEIDSLSPFAAIPISIMFAITRYPQSASEASRRKNVTKV